MVLKTVPALLLVASLLMVAPTSADGPRDYVDCADGNVSIKDLTNYPRGVLMCTLAELQECIMQPQTQQVRTPYESVEEFHDYILECTAHETGLDPSLSFVSYEVDGDGWTMQVEVTVHTAQPVGAGVIVHPHGIHVYEFHGIHGCYAGWEPGHGYTGFEPYYFCGY